MSVTLFFVQTKSYFFEVSATAFIFRTLPDKYIYGHDTFINDLTHYLSTNERNKILKLFYAL